MKEKDALMSNILYVQLCDDLFWKNEKQVHAWLKTFSEEKLFSLFMDVYTIYALDMQKLPSLIEEEHQLEYKIKGKEKAIPSSEDTNMNDLQLSIHIAELIHTRHALLSQIEKIGERWSSVKKERLEKIAAIFFSLSIKNLLTFHQIIITPRPAFLEKKIDRITLSRTPFNTFFPSDKTSLLQSPFRKILCSGRLLGMKNQQPCIFDPDEGFLFLHKQETEQSATFSEIFRDNSSSEKATLRQGLLKEILLLSSLWKYYEKLGTCTGGYAPIIFKEQAGANEEENMEDIAAAFAANDSALLSLSLVPEVFDKSLEEYRETGVFKTRLMRERPYWLTSLNPFSFSEQQYLVLPCLFPDKKFCTMVEDRAGRKAMFFLQMKEIEFAAMLLFDEIELSILPF